MALRFGALLVFLGVWTFSCISLGMAEDLLTIIDSTSYAALSEGNKTSLIFFPSDTDADEPTFLSNLEKAAEVYRHDPIIFGKWYTSDNATFPGDLKEALTPFLRITTTQNKTFIAHLSVDLHDFFITINMAIENGCRHPTFMYDPEFGRIAQVEYSWESAYKKCIADYQTLKDCAMNFIPMMKSTLNEATSNYKSLKIYYNLFVKLSKTGNINSLTKDDTKIKQKILNGATSEEMAPFIRRYNIHNTIVWLIHTSLRNAEEQEL